MPPPALHPLQQQALEALDWLHSQRREDRQTGRTTVQALHYLRRLVRGDTDHNGRVFIDDHADAQAADEHLLRTIMYVAGQFGIDVRAAGRRAMRTPIVLDGYPSREAVDIVLGLVSHETQQTMLNMAHAQLRLDRPHSRPSSGQPNPCAETPLGTHEVVEPPPEPVRRSAWEHIADNIF